MTAVAGDCRCSRMAVDRSRCIVTFYEPPSPPLEGLQARPQSVPSQGEVVYMDLVGPSSPSISQYQYIYILSLHPHGRILQVREDSATARTKTAQEVADAVLSAWIKGPGGGGPRDVPGGQRHGVHSHDRTGNVQYVRSPVWPL